MIENLNAPAAQLEDERRYDDGSHYGSEGAIADLEGRVIVFAERFDVPFGSLRYFWTYPTEADAKLAVERKTRRGEKILQVLRVDQPPRFSNITL